MWRPPAHIRVKAVAIARRGDQILVVEVLDDNGVCKGWCPLGGGANFGESAEDALRREIREELDCGLTVDGPPSVFENIYEHHGVTGHEVVFAFPVTFDDQAIYAKHRFEMREDSGSLNIVEWVDLARFRGGSDVLFPLALKVHVLAM